MSIGKWFQALFTSSAQRDAEQAIAEEKWRREREEEARVMFEHRKRARERMAARRLTASDMPSRSDVNDSTASYAPFLILAASDSSDCSSSSSGSSGSCGGSCGGGGE